MPVELVSPDQWGCYNPAFIGVEIEVVYYITEIW